MLENRDLLQGFLSRMSSIGSLLHYGVGLFLHCHQKPCVSVRKSKLKQLFKNEQENMNMSQTKPCSNDVSYVKEILDDFEMKRKLKRDLSLALGLSSLVVEVLGVHLDS